MSQKSHILDAPYALLHLLYHIDKNGKICTEHLSDILAEALGKEEKPMSKRNALRYLKTIQHFFQTHYDKEILQKSTKGCYEVVEKDLLRKQFDFADKNELMSYLQIVEELLPFYYNQIDDEVRHLYQKEKRNKRKTYLFRSAPFEDLKERTHFALFEKAIEERRKIRLQYYFSQNKKFAWMENIRPLRILYMEGNFYLAVLSDEKNLNNGFKFLRISKIAKVDLLDESFHETEEVLSAHRFLDEEMQSAFSLFGVSPRHVRIVGDTYAAYHFSQKKHFPSQTHRLLEDGGIEIELYLTNYLEIAPLIKRWIPHLRIIEPKEWAERLKKELCYYCNSL